MEERIDRTYEVERRVTAIHVKSSDGCSFFKIREGCIFGDKKCRYCKYGLFAENDNRGLCKYR